MKGNRDKMRKSKKYSYVIFATVLLLITCFILFRLDKTIAILMENKPETPGTGTSMQIKPNKPKYVHGVHLNAWSAGSSDFRKRFQVFLDETTLNTVVIAVKESNGEVYIPGVKMAEEFKAYVPAMPDIKTYIEKLKSRNVYTVARIVVFKDSIAVKHKPQWAVKNPEGGTWADHKGLSWLDPYNRDNWEYTFAIAEQCVNLGFEEIQFDYVRFPSDGIIKNCRYSVRQSSIAPAQCIVNFLKEANLRLKSKYNVNISVDVFGLTTSADHDMGIGQNIIDMAREVDFICPMVYPSHYPKGSYGIENPNNQPYRTVYIGLNYADKKLGENSNKLRPYLQDFSLGYKYHMEEVLAQMQACYDNNIFEWTLWNPGSKYNYLALKSKETVNKKKLEKTNKAEGSGGAGGADSTGGTSGAEGGPQLLASTTGEDASAPTNDVITPGATTNAGVNTNMTPEISSSAAKPE